MALSKEEILLKNKLMLEGQKQMVQNQYELQIDRINGQLAQVNTETVKLAASNKEIVAKDVPQG